MRQSDLLAQQLDVTRRWTLNLIADLKGGDWTFQPAPGLAHALWICGHLATAQHSLIHIRCLGQGVIDDVFKEHFRIGAAVRSPNEHEYPAVETVLATMAEVQHKSLEAIRGMDDAFLGEPASGPGGKPHPLFDDRRGAISHASRHEAFHAGQLALIRRLLGKPFLR